MHKHNFDGLMVKLASAQTIEQRSHGSIEHADTVNYRTGKPKLKGLFCESVFGPMKNFECSCGKYKGVRYKGIVCERCGVEITNTRVRRERMGHIDLAVPVVHVRYQSSVSGGIHHLLGISSNEIQKILGFVKYMCTSQVSDEQRELLAKSIDGDLSAAKATLDELYLTEKERLSSDATQVTELEQAYLRNKKDLEKEADRVLAVIAGVQYGTTLLESDYRNIFSRYEDHIQMQSGPAAIHYMLKKIVVKDEIKRQLKLFPTIKSADKKKKIFILIKLLINLYASGVEPESMVITKLPVIPPDLRPVVQLDGGRFATSDVNLFYRRVLMRNIRLRKMIQVGMPDVVKKNEIRLLQESVNNLLVGEKNANRVGGGGSGSKVSKSLSDMLSGKEGIFRRNLLGKRVDYSGRSVITVGPDLKLDQCGLPLYVAMKIFAPFVIGKLIQNKVVYTPKQAEKMIKDGHPLTLAYLEEVIQGKYVLLNRAPTLHRLSIEAFKVKLMPGKTIRLHPLVCSSFNADFDGDQMAVHLPISDEAQKEAKELIAADKNVLKPSSGEPTIAHSQDMVLGVYYLTDDALHPGKEMGYYGSIADVMSSYHASNIGIKDFVTVKINNEYVKTTVGRCVFHTALPEGYPFINTVIKKKKLHKLLNDIFDDYGQEVAVVMADKVKDMGFKYGTVSGVTINIMNIEVPEEREGLLKDGDMEIDKIYSLFYRGLLSEVEKHRLVIQTWTKVKERIEGVVKKGLSDAGDDLFTMIDSGAKGSYTNSTQISGMKGLVLNQRGDVIELPIKGNYIQGLSPIEYFISTHASRKGKADTALRTAESGYLTRKLCDSAQEVVVRQEECGTLEYLLITRDEVASYGGDYEEALYGRTVAQDVYDTHGNLVAPIGTMIDKKMLKVLVDLDLEVICVRSVMTCKTVSGVCQKCYGMDLATRAVIALGSPVGIIAAQSIGEPATQLTMKQFHGGGGIVGNVDMAQGIDRVKQLFEVRIPKVPAIVSPCDGTIHFREEGKMRFITLQSDFIRQSYFIKEDYTIVVKVGASIAKGGVYATKKTSKLKIKNAGIVLEVNADHIIIGSKDRLEYSIAGLNCLKTVEGENVYKGEILTTGAVDLKQYQSVVGDLEAMKYVLREVKGVYGETGLNLNNKHIEVVIKQLFSKVFVVDAGDSTFVPGTHVKYEEMIKTNEDLKKAGKKQAQFTRLVLGLTSIAKGTDSWMSAASFQETVRVMVDASLKGAIDELNDLKSNVIIGRLLPLGDEYVRKYINNESDVIVTSDDDMAILQEEPV